MHLLHEGEKDVAVELTCTSL